MRLRNSSVLARSCSSESSFVSGSSALMRSTSGIRRFISRSLLVPKTLAINLLINAIFPIENSVEAPGFSPVNLARFHLCFQGFSVHVHAHYRHFKANTLDAAHRPRSHFGRPPILTELRPSTRMVL